MESATEGAVRVSTDSLPNVPDTLVTLTTLESNADSLFTLTLSHIGENFAKKSSHSSTEHHNSSCDHDYAQYSITVTQREAKYCGPTANGPTISFSSFRQSFTSNVNYLKRRFSSGDLSSECDENESQVDPYRKAPPVTSQPQAPPPPPPPTQAPSQSNSGDLSLNLRPGSKTTSAPSSPAKSRESLLQRVQSLTGQARDQGASILGAAVSSASRVTSSVSSGRYLTLLVIDDQNTDWSKYFRGKKIGDYDIRVEQAEFKELNVTANSDGANVALTGSKGGTRVGRSFRPDFLLVRQNLRDAGENHNKLLLALKFGGVPSINNLNAIYNFQVN
ncbi:Syn [Trypoxylus dichotomus]